MRKLESPYMEIKDRQIVPGPGNYFQEDSKEKILKRLQMTQNIVLTKDKPPFNSEVARDCNKSIEKSDALGPGAYIDINNPSNSAFRKNLSNQIEMSKAAAQLFNQSKNGFGGQSERFKSLSARDMNNHGQEELNFGLASKATIERLEDTQNKKNLMKSNYLRLAL